MYKKKKYAPANLKYKLSNSQQERLYDLLFEDSEEDVDVKELRTD